MKKNITVLIIAVCILFAVTGCISKSGKAAGMVKGKLADCPDRPNCVCSEQKDDNHYIEPFIIPRNIDSIPLTILKESIQEAGGVIQTDTGTYLAATFSSTVFRFIDDLEIRIDSVSNVIHIRSASRTGYSDFGVNRKRIESIKYLFYKKIKNKNRGKP